MGANSSKIAARVSGSAGHRRRRGPRPGRARARAGGAAPGGGRPSAASLGRSATLRRELVLVLAVETETRVGDDEELQARCLPEQLAAHRRRRAQVLERVEHEQKLLAPQLVRERT